MIRWLLVVLALPLASCDTLGKQLPAPPKVDVSLLPVVDGAQRLLMDIAPARIEVDPTTSDAITALGACADLVTYCYDPGTHSVTECFQGTPDCQTDTPWTEKDACCPKACKTSFNKAVKNGASELDAFESVVLTDSSCFPGVTAALENP